jgi:hypothetical protein
MFLISNLEIAFVHGFAHHNVLSGIFNNVSYVILHKKIGRKKSKYANLTQENCFGST